MNTSKLLKTILVLIGIVVMVSGLNVGLGGMRTLGWQLSRDFISITEPDVFQLQDSHIRFIGGVWFGVGVMFVLGGFALAKLRPTLVTLCLMIAGAGLFRFSAMDMSVILSGAIGPSVLLELIGFPVLAWVLVRSETVTASASLSRSNNAEPERDNL